MLAMGALALLSACSPKADTQMGQSVPTASNDSRIRVTRVGVIEDDLAYRERRGLYVIVDQKTGKEFIGISGIGITEVGVHQEGKASVSDER